MNRVTRGALALGFAAFLTLNTIDAGAQTVVSIPCDDCDNANDGPGTSPGFHFGWECVMNDHGTGRLVAVAQVQRGWGGPVTFQLDGFTPSSVTLRPGQTARMTRTAQGGEDVPVSGHISGHRVNRDVNKGTFNCPCDAAPPPTTVPPVPTTPPTTPATTVPGSPPPSTSSRPPVTPPASSTPPLTGTLPHVGIDVAPLLWIAAALLAAGFACLIPRHHRKTVR